MSTPLRVLFVEDSEDDVVLLIRQLKLGGYQPLAERVDTADGLRSALHRGGWEIIISDYSMPRFNGMEALAVTLQASPTIPFILISGTVGEEVAVESVKAGASDYLMKQNLIRFVPAVARALREATERRAMMRAESVLREQRSLLSMIYDNTSDSLTLFTWDPIRAGWTLITANRTAMRMFQDVDAGIRESDLIGKSIESVVSRVVSTWAASQISILDDFYRAAETGKSVSREYHFVSKDLDAFVEIIAIPFYGPDGRSRHVMIVTRDITARHQAIADQRSFEARIAESRKMEALGQLAGGVAHDFNNILTGILGFADVIQKSSINTNISGYSTEIIQAARRAKELVRQILTFSRRRPTERKPMSIAEVVQEAMKIVAEATPSTTKIVVNVQENLPFVFGDATQLHQLIMNLGVNAVQAIADKGGELRVEVDAIDLDAQAIKNYPLLSIGTHLRLSVTDTGPGMPQNVVDHLFEPFFTTKPPGVGTGLGLSVVHGVVQNHEGSIRVMGQQDRGTSFEVLLPAVNAPLPSGESPPVEPSKQPNSKRILFVDDEASIARLAQVMLKSLGHSVTTFGKPELGLDALKTNPSAFDLLITDLTMPGMTGVELARGVRTLRSDIPIILSSGYADDVPEETLKALGIVQVLPKPFQMQALGEAISAATG